MMNRSMDQIIAGSEVYGSDNEKIGKVQDVGQNYFLVQKGFLFVKDLYLPTRTIARVDGERVYLNVPKHEAEQWGRRSFQRRAMPGMARRPGALRTAPPRA